jgi:hypothetical protein
VADNCRLLEQLASLQGASVRGVPSQAFSLSTSSLDHEDIQIKNPLVGDKAWFQTYKSYLPPIYIGEAACTACASRLRQLLAGDSSPSHITRVEWTKDAVLSTAAKPGTPWPDLGQAQLLVRIALNHLSKTYHVVLKHDALDGLEKVYQTVQFDDPTREAHYFVLFALGQAHSAPTARRDQLPGLEYYAQALDLMRTRPERSSLVYIETLVLLVRSVHASYIRSSMTSICSLTRPGPFLLPPRPTTYRLRVDQRRNAVRRDTRSASHST